MRLALVALVISVTTALAAEVETPSMESGHYGDLCRDKSTKRGVLNEETYRFCFSQQTEGNKKLARLLAENARYPWLKAVLDHATEEVSKRGVRNDEVLAFAVEQQIEAYKDFAYAEGRQDFVPRVGEVCRQKWTERGAPNWEMIMFCYKQFTGTN